MYAVFVHFLHFNCIRYQHHSHKQLEILGQSPDTKLISLCGLHLDIHPLSEGQK